MPEVQDVDTDLQFRSPRVNVEDRPRARRALRPESQRYPERAVRRLRPAHRFHHLLARNQYRVLMEVQPKYQAFADYLSKIYFKTNAGALVPLDSLAKVKEDVGPQSITTPASFRR